MNTNIDNFIKKIIPLMVILLLAYIINLGLMFMLPKSGLSYINSGSILNQDSYVSLYSQEIKKTIQKKDNKNVLPNETLKEFKLNAIYSLNDNSGWIVLIKKNNEAIILENGEEINGYKLISLHKNHVVFEKNGKEYKIVLDETIKEIDPIIEIKDKKNDNLKAIVKNGDLVSVNRNYLDSYISNIDKIWQDIAIKEIRTNRKIEGFEIINIKKGSDLEKLGLKKGDIIKSVNNKELKSYADAFDIYNNIKSINYLNIEILRNNNKMELNYEIN